MKKINYSGQIKKAILPSTFLSLLMVVLLSILFVTLSSPRKENKVEMLIGAKECDTSRLVDYVSKGKQDYIYQIEASCYESNSNTFLTYYVNTLGSMDITIIPESIFTIGAFTSNIAKYAELKLNVINKYMDLSSCSFFENNGKKYGIKIYDFESKKGKLTDYIKYEECSYYLFISASSLHGGELNNSAHDGIFDIVKSIIEI